MLVALSGQAHLPRLIPQERMAETIAAYRSIGMGVMPLGALAGAWVATSAGHHVAVWGWVALVLLSVIPWLTRAATGFDAGPEMSAPTSTEDSVR